MDAFYSLEELEESAKIAWMLRKGRVTPEPSAKSRKARSRTNAAPFFVSLRGLAPRA